MTLRSVLECGILVAGIAATVQTFVALRHADELLVRVSDASKPVLNCKGNGACLPAQLLGAAGAVEKSAGVLAKNLPTIASSSAAASQQTAAAMKTAAVAMKNLDGLITDVRGTVGELHQVIADLNKDAATLTKSADATIRDAGESLNQLTALEKTLQQQIQSGSPEAMATLQAMRKLAENPAIEDVLKNVDSGTLHGAAVVETMDIATRGLRQKIGRVKWLINQAIGMVKITVPLP